MREPTLAGTAPHARDGKPPRDIRAWVAGIFGLVHGFGFAAVLKEFGLPITALGWSLFSFNFGVEIGQLGIVLVVAALLAAIRRRSEPLNQQMVFAGSVIVILAGGYWFVQRVFLTGGDVMRRGVILGLLVAAGAGSMVVAAQQAQQPQPLTIEKVKDNLYVIMGGGGNTAAYIIAKGVVLVDTKLANYGQPILDKVKSVTDKPITHIINTHTHGDHVGSNEFFPAAVEIVAQENTAANMVKMPAFQDPAKKHGLADRTFKDKMTVLAGRESIDLYYFGRAHTNGDAFVVFRDLRVMHAATRSPVRRRRSWT